MANEAVQQLLASQRDDGGWGPHPSSPSRTESTALAALALTRGSETDREDGVAAAVGVAAAAAATGWLLERQLDSGAWPLGDEVPGPNWSTALASLALSHDPVGRRAAEAGGDWLLSQRGRGSPWWARLMSLFLRPSETVELDRDLIGWPWVGDTFSWVEPTCYALFALARLGSALPPARATSRIEEAERMLLDRQCLDGGWNYGNSRVFGETLWSYPDTTSLVLLAFAGRSAEPAVATALDALPGLVEGNDSALALGLSAAALATHGRDAEPIRVRLRDRLDASTDGDVRGLAWAALGLTPGEDPLGLRDA